MLQPVYPQLRKYPCAMAVTLGANSGRHAGGVPPLGYQARDRKLVMVEIEVKIAASSAAMPNSARYDC